MLHIQLRGKKEIKANIEENTLTLHIPLIAGSG